MQVTVRKFVKEFQQVAMQNAAEKSLQLGKGQAPTHEEYKRICGWIAGMEAASELADRMLRQLEERDMEGDLPPLDPPPGDQQ